MEVRYRYGGDWTCDGSNHRITVSDEEEEFLKSHLWIRNLEGVFLASKSREDYFRLSAWEENYDH